MSLLRKPDPAVAITPFVTVPRYVASVARRDDLRRHEDEVDAKIAAHFAKKPPAADSKISAIDEAEQALAGKKIVSARDDLASLQDLKNLLERAVSEADGNIDAIMLDATAAAHQQLRPRHVELMRRVFQCAVQLSEAMSDEREFRQELVAAGYPPTSEFLPPVLDWIGLAYHLGHLDDWNSQISAFRRRLIDRGYLG